jgi:hypothetical protein
VASEFFWLAVRLEEQVTFSDADQLADSTNRVSGTQIVMLGTGPPDPIRIGLVLQQSSW